MEITKFGHSCLLVEDGDSRVLLDPGAFSSGFEQLTGLAGILITHQHMDHLDVDKVRALVDANGGVALVCDEDSAAQLREAGLSPDVIRQGDTRTVGTLGVRAIGTQHAVIHPDIPRITNVGYFLGERLFHPGDALTQPDTEVEILALPIVAPWSSVRETVDYVRAVSPRVAIPIHDAITTASGIYDGVVGSLGPESMRLRRIDDEPLTV